ncbi:hypothetical protein [Adlercreutzia muris]|uniref:DUF1492 domain-containing protein n=1 Tax=Adlercreutzia muris TaxID=1796610 RepID=A0A7C8FWJ0_9ACTN|nr:hypothetical protein [Adlercreutzia muris]KAB1647981.1 hypothetical protein F8D48_06730 [Adlercreutzia muris]MCR2027726.1 hypothetical protein [Adlercreutzia muris]
MAENTAEVVDILRGYGRACDELESLTEEHNRIISALYSITSDPSSSGGGSSADKLGGGVARLVDLCNQIDDEIKRYIEARDRARSLVRAVMRSNIQLGQCLHYRYIDRDKPSVAAYRMGYTDRNYRRVHTRALQLAQEIIDLGAER